MTQKTFRYDGLTVSCQMVGPENVTGKLPLLCMLGGADDFELNAVLSNLKQASPAIKPFVIASISVDDWASSFSPWPFQASKKIGGPFWGKGQETLNTLCAQIIPELASSFPINRKAENNLLIGYSLAGLFALWAMYNCDNFGRCACCSGSLWYPDWIDYAKTHHPHTGSRIYLSLGKNEELSRNKVFGSVGDATRATAQILKDDPSVADSVYVENEGGHTFQVAERMADGILWCFEIMS
jgi:predicted alpha/beta superfamily hydrolase